MGEANRRLDKMIYDYLQQNKTKDPAEIRKGCGWPGQITDARIKNSMKRLGVK